MEGDAGDMETHDKGVERLMDDYLKSKGFYRKKIAKDGSCLFRAVAEQVLSCQSRHTEVRATCVDYLKKNREKYESFIEGNFEEYLQRLEDPQNWVGEVEISALALIYRHDFIIFQEPGKAPVNITENSFSNKVRLCFLNGNHYDSVYPQDFVNKAALCQSILYELLYERVYGVDRGVVSACLRSSRDTGDDGYGECKSSEESDLEEEDDFWPNDAVVPSNMNSQRPSNSNQLSKPPKSHQWKVTLSQRVQMSLNPRQFRNVEYDVWLRSKRAQQKRDFCIAAGMQYTVGDKCKVRLDNTGRFYSAYIQAVDPGNGPVTVFIEELGKKQSIPLWNLRPASSVDGESWSTVAERGKRQSLVNGNGPHSGKAPRPSDPPPGPASARSRAASTPLPGAALTERDGRGGRKLGKGPAVGPPARVHKQHSWPPQAAAAEQAAADGTARASARSPDTRNGCMQTRPPADLTVKSQKPDPKKGPSRRGEFGAPGGPPPEPRFGLSEDERLARQEEQKSQALLEIMQRDERSFPALVSQGGPRPAVQAQDAGRRGPPPQASERRAYRRKGDAQELSQDSDNSLRSVQREEKNGQLASAQPACSSGAQLLPSPEPSISAVSAPPPAVSAPPAAASVPPPAISAPTAAASAPPPATSAPPPATPVPPPAASVPPPAISAPTAVESVPPPAVSAFTPAESVPPPSVSAPSPAVPAPTPAVSTPAPPVSAPPPAISTTPPAVSAPPPAVSATPPAVSTPACAPSAPVCTPATVPYTPTPPATTTTTTTTTTTSTPAAAPPGHAQSPAPPTPSTTPAAPPAAAPHPPPQQQRDPPPTGFPPTSLPVEPSPYNGASPCPPGVMSQIGIAPGPPPTPPVLAEHLSHPHPHAHSPSLPPQGPLAFPQMTHPLYPDPLYPGFPLNDKDEMASVPQYSYMRNGQDLPREIGVLRFFFNLGIKAYTHPTWLPHTYLYQLQQAHMTACAMQPKVSFLASWYPEGPPQGPFRMPEGYGHPPSYGHAPAGGRGPAQFEHAHCPVQPAMGVAMVGAPLGPQHTDLGPGSDGRPPLGYSPQPGTPLPTHLGMPWPGPRPNAYPGAYSTPPPPPPQYLPPGPPYPAVSPGYHVPRLSTGTPVDAPSGRPVSHPPEGPPPAPERGRGPEKQAVPVPTGLPPSASLPVAQLAPPPEVHAAMGGGEARHSRSTPDPPGPPAATPPHKLKVSVRDDHRSVLIDQGPGNEARSGEAAAGGGGPRDGPRQGGESQAYGSAYSSEVWEEEGEPGEEALQSGRYYYGRSYKSRRGYEDGRGPRDNRWRGYRGRRGSDDRRDYAYRDRRVGDGSPNYPGSHIKGQNSRGRGRGYNQYSNSREARETGYASPNQRSNTYVEP